jgi:hypothetical protein
MEYAESLHTSAGEEKASGLYHPDWDPDAIHLATALAVREVESIDFY